MLRWKDEIQLTIDRIDINDVFMRNLYGFTDILLSEDGNTLSYTIHTYQEKEIRLESEQQEKPTVSGTVSGIKGATVEIAGTKVEVQEDGSFVIEAEGTFDVVVRIPGALTHTVINVVAEEGGVILPEIVPVKGDVNGDDMINIMDMGAFRQNFGKVGANIANAFTDVNGDNMVNIMDMGTFRMNFGKTAAKDCTVQYEA